LLLWQHRAALPNGKRPFEDLEPVIRAVESLDPDDEKPRYFRSAWPGEHESKEKSEADTWLELASGLDYTAKSLIAYCLAQAAHAATDKAQEWVRLAEAAGAEDGVPEIVIRFISAAVDLHKEPDLQAEARGRLQDRVRRLEGFTNLTEHLARDLKAQLEALPKPKDDNDPAERVVLPFQPPFPPRASD
jgi:hypothetical protein